MTNLRARFLVPLTGSVLCRPPPEHGGTVHPKTYDHVTVSGVGSALWGQGFQEVVVTMDSGPGGITGGGGGGGGTNRIT